MVGRSRKSYFRLAELASSCSWFYSRMKDAGWVQDFIFFVVVSGVNQGMRRKGNYKISLRDFRGGKFFRELLKITGNVVWKWGAGGVVIAWVYGFYNRRLIRGEVLWIANLRLEQAMRNLTGGDQEILLTLILLL